MRSHTPDLLKHAVTSGLFVELLTHGWWQDQTRIERAALADPGRITISLDGIDEVHDLVRGREGFVEKTRKSIDTLIRLRKQHNLGYEIRLKTVIMNQNFHVLQDIARFATQDRMHVFFQPIEQNYGSTEDPLWFQHSTNWPRDIEACTAAIEEIIQLKRRGLHIANSLEQLKAMIPYFRDPNSHRVAVQSHSAHEQKSFCSALTTLEIRLMETSSFVLLWRRWEISERLRSARFGRIVRVGGAKDAAGRNAVQRKRRKRIR